MSYYKALGLEKEPFSTSPDPAFFFESVDHKSALYRLQIALTLKRGLSLIIGDVGTGKTTLSRKLAQLLSGNKDIFFKIILNPMYETKEQFLSHLVSIFQIENAGSDVISQINAIEHFLFQKGVEENKTIVLLIDEAQKLNEPCLEILRTLLNYETNEYKLLQLILMSQMEILPMVRRIKNFWDRIALKYVINPLEEEELEAMIRYRLERAGYQGSQPLFTKEAINMIHRYTRGYPRRVSMLCHDALEVLIMQGKAVVSGDTIKELIARGSQNMLYSHDVEKLALSPDF